MKFDYKFGCDKILRFTSSFQIFTLSLVVTVFTPTQPDDYATNYFLSGFAGVIPGGLYDVMNSYIASHG